MTAPRALFYSHDAFGLGHGSRTLTVAGAFSRRRPDVGILVVAGAAVVGGHALPPMVDLLPLPRAAKRHVCDRSRGPDSAGLWELRAGILAAAAREFRPDVVYVDHAPDGMKGELRQAIESLRALPRPPRFIVSLDEFLAEPADAKRQWSEPEARRPLAEVYDQILIRGDRAVFETAAEYGLSPEFDAKLTYSGYVAETGGPADADAARAELGATTRPLLAVAPGGGADGRPLLEAALRVLALKRLDVAALVVTGHLLADADRRAGGQLAERLPNVTLRCFEPDLGRYLAAADLVVCMAGYSSIAEVLAHRKRCLVVPRVKPWPEQRVRAERLARLGLIATFHPDALTPELLRAEIVRSLAAPAAHRRLRRRPPLRRRDRRAAAGVHAGVSRTSEPRRVRVG